MIDLLEFDAEDHRYTLGGVELPGVTKVIASQFPLNIPQDRLEFARQLGRAIHAACELYDRDTLDYASVDPKVVPYLEAWIAFRKQTQCSVVAIEQRVHHSQLCYCGTLDRVLILGDECAVVDLKRPVLDARVGVQLAAYQYAYNDMVRLESKKPSTYVRAFPRKIDARYGLQLRGDRTYRLRKYADGHDLSVFVASLTIYNWRLTNG